MIEIKTIYISDLHIDVNSRIMGVDEIDLINILINKLNYLIKKDSDIKHVYIVGDLFWGMGKSLLWLNYIETKINATIYFIPGNHELMMNKDKIDNGILTSSSQELLDIYKNSKWNILNKEIKINDRESIVSTLGWYDYEMYNKFLVNSNKDGMNEKELIETVTEFRMTGNAGKYLNFKNDRDLCEAELVEFKNLVSIIPEKRLTLVTHFVPNIKLLNALEDESLYISYALMGSVGLSDFIDRCDNIKEIIYGHNHFLTDLELSINNKLFRTVCVGFKKNWKEKSFEEMIDSRLYIKEYNSK